MSVSCLFLLLLCVVSCIAPRYISNPRITQSYQGRTGTQTSAGTLVTSPQSQGTTLPTPYTSWYRQQLQPSAGHFSQMNSNQGGVNPDNWVGINDNLDQLPISVIIPMTMADGKLFAEMKVGTARPGQPAQTLTVEFNTGSTKLWLVTKSLCDTGVCRANANPFDRSMSTTYQQNGLHLKSSYGSLVVTGTYGIDTITLGEPGNQLVIKDQMIGEAETITGTLQIHSDAICGMSLVSPAMMSSEPASFLYTMTKQYGTTLPFGFYYNSQDPQKSQMIFGEGYEQFIVEDLNTHSVQLAPGKDKYDGWYVNFGGWEIEKTDQPDEKVTVDAKMLALVDTGASLIDGPENIIAQIKKYVFEGSGLSYDEVTYTFDCGTDYEQVISALPEISFKIDEKKYTIAPRQYIGNMGDKCKILFGGGSGIDHIILGRPFFNRYFSRFNHSEKTVQFALAK